MKNILCKFFSYITALLGASLIFCSSTFAYTINDNTLQFISYNNVAGEVIGAGSPFVPTPFDTVSNIPDSSFDTYGIDVGRTGSTISIDIYTNFVGHNNFTEGSTTYDQYLADLAISVDGGLTYGYGYSFANNPGSSINTAGLYTVTGWNTSIGLNEDTGISESDKILYGKYNAASPNAASIVSINAGNLAQALGYTRTGSSTYKYSIAFDISLLGGNVSEIDLFWATDTSSNDIISGSAPVPVPGAIYLFGSGVFALLGMRRRKSTK